MAAVAHGGFGRILRVCRTGLFGAGAAGLGLTFWFAPPISVSWN